MRVRVTACARVTLLGRRKRTPPDGRPDCCGPLIPSGEWREFKRWAASEWFKAVAFKGAFSNTLGVSLFSDKLAFSSLLRCTLSAHESYRPVIKRKSKGNGELISAEKFLPANLLYEYVYSNCMGKDSYGVEVCRLRWSRFRLHGYRSFNVWFRRLNVIETPDQTSRPSLDE